MAEKMFEKSHREMFAEIAEILRAVEGADELVKFMEYKVAQATKPREKKIDEAYEARKAEILAWMEDAGIEVTLAEIRAEFDLSPQKAGAAMKGLKEAGAVKSLFREGDGEKVWVVVDSAEDAD